MVDYPKLGKKPWWSRSGTTVAADGTPLAFASGGPPDARAIVCSNGVGVSTFFWDYIGEHFHDDHRVVVWDYRGHGASGRPRDARTITMASTADDLARVMDANHVDRAILLGHSMGCQVILEFYRLFEDRVLGLVPILGSFGHPADTFIDPRVGPVLYQAAYEVATRIPDLINIGTKLGLRSRAVWPLARLSDWSTPTFAAKVISSPTWSTSPDSTRGCFSRMARAAQEHDAGPILGEVRCPTLVVAGEKDLFTPRHLSLEMSQRIEGAELLEIRHGSHAALVEQPELINLRLEKFIRDRIEPLERAAPPADPA